MAHKKILYLICIVLLMASETIYSADYQFKPGFVSSVIRTDNVDLQKEEQAKRSDVIYEIAPQFDFIANGNKMDLSISYKMQYLEYDKSDVDTVNHQANAETKLEIIENNLFLDADVTRSQEYVDLDKPVTAGNYAQSNNRSDVTTYRVNPKLRIPLWDRTIFKARKSITRIEYEDRENIELEKEETTYSLNTKMSGDRLSVGINYKETDDKSTKYKSIRRYISLDYSVTESFDVFTEVGTEYTNRESELVQPDTNYNKLGFVWKPNNRSSLTASTGEQAQGKTSSIDATFRSRTKTFGVNYTNDVSSVIDARSQNTDIFSDEQASDSEVDYFQAVITRRIYVRESYRIIFRKETAKSSFNVRYSEEKRSYEDASLDEELTGIQASYIWNLSSRVSTTINYSETTRTDELGNDINTIDTTAITFTKKIMQNGHIQGGYTRIRQELGLNPDRYDTRMVNLSLFVKF